MKILFVTLRALEINSSVTISNMGLLKGLIDCGCEVDLIMPTVNKRLKQCDAIDQNMDSVNTIRIEGNTIYENLVIRQESPVKRWIINMIRVVFYWFSLHDNTISLISKADITPLKGKEYDLVISTSDPKTSHIYVNKLIKQGLKYNVWIQHWGDPLSLDVTNKTIYPRVFIKNKERQIISCANKIVYVSPLTKKMQCKMFPEYAERMLFIPLPYYKEKIYDTNSNIKITLGYFGDYNTKTRNIIPLYDFCVMNNQYNLIIAGSSNIELAETDNVKVLPRISQEKVDELEAKCDILVCICNKFGTQIPGKIYYYSATNKPILVLLDGDFRDEIEAYLASYSRFNICDNCLDSINSKIAEMIVANATYASCKEFSPKEIAKTLLDSI
ncbi:MAG: hypothetical protein H6Q69_655 [Firmicutes bacterium]|nr:hypothetical protein [Bacillota bacterium]